MTRRQPTLVPASASGSGSASAPEASVPISQESTATLPCFFSEAKSAISWTPTTCDRVIVVPGLSKEGSVDLTWNREESWPTLADAQKYKSRVTTSAMTTYARFGGRYTTDTDSDGEDDEEEEENEMLGKVVGYIDKTFQGKSLDDLKSIFTTQAQKDLLTRIVGEYVDEKLETEDHKDVSRALSGHIASTVRSLFSNVAEMKETLILPDDLETSCSNDSRVELLIMDKRQYERYEKSQRSAVLHIMTDLAIGQLSSQEKATLGSHPQIARHLTRSILKDATFSKMRTRYMEALCEREEEADEKSNEDEGSNEDEDEDEESDEDEELDAGQALVCPTQ